MSSYSGPFHDLSPSDQADIRSWSEPDEAAACAHCGEAMECQDVEVFELFGEIACPDCAADILGERATPSQKEPGQ